MIWNKSDYFLDSCERSFKKWSFSTQPWSLFLEEVKLFTPLKLSFPKWYKNPYKQLFRNKRNIARGWCWCNDVRRLIEETKLHYHGLMILRQQCISILGGRSHRSLSTLKFSYWGVLLVVGVILLMVKTTLESPSFFGIIYMWLCIFALFLLCYFRRQDIYYWADAVIWLKVHGCVEGLLEEEEKTQSLPF